MFIARLFIVRAAQMPRQDKSQLLSSRTNAPLPPPLPSPPPPPLPQRPPQPDPDPPLIEPLVEPLIDYEVTSFFRPLIEPLVEPLIEYKVTSGYHQVPTRTRREGDPIDFEAEALLLCSGGITVPELARQAEALSRVLTVPRGVPVDGKDDHSGRYRSQNNATQPGQEPVVSAQKKAYALGFADCDEVIGQTQNSVLEAECTIGDQLLGRVFSAAQSAAQSCPALPTRGRDYEGDQLGNHGGAGLPGHGAATGTDGGEGTGEREAAAAPMADLFNRGQSAYGRVIQHLLDRTVALDMEVRHLKIARNELERASAWALDEALRRAATAEAAVEQAALIIEEAAGVVEAEEVEKAEEAAAAAGAAEVIGAGEADAAEAADAVVGMERYAGRGARSNMAEANMAGARRRKRSRAPLHHTSRSPAPPPVSWPIPRIHITQLNEASFVPGRPMIVTGMAGMAADDRSMDGKAGIGSAEQEDRHTNEHGFPSSLTLDNFDRVCGHLDVQVRESSNSSQSNGAWAGLGEFRSVKLSRFLAAVQTTTTTTSSSSSSSSSSSDGSNGGDNGSGNNDTAAPRPPLSSYYLHDYSLARGCPQVRVCKATCGVFRIVYRVFVYVCVCMRSWQICLHILTPNDNRDNDPTMVHICTVVHLHKAYLSPRNVKSWMPPRPFFPILFHSFPSPPTHR